MNDTREGAAQNDPAFDHTPLGVLVDGAKKTFDNAERLFREAEILAAQGAVARALCLHQISLEECSKVNNLGAWAVSLVVGIEVDQKGVLAAFGRHAAKNKSNAYMLEPSDAELDARSRGDWPAAQAAFKQTQDEFHQASNDAKNAALYVDWLDGEFVAPNDRITEPMLDEIRERNAEFLGYAYNGLRSLERLESSRDKLEPLLANLIERAEEARERGDDPVKATDTLLSEFLEAGKRSLSIGRGEDSDASTAEDPN